MKPGEPTAQETRETALRHDIMNAIKANGHAITGELWLNLAFLTEAGLKSVARDLNIKTA